MKLTHRVLPVALLSTAFFIYTQSPAVAQSSASGGLASAMPTQQIGGLEALTVRRKPSGDITRPQFLSVTLLPGRAMNMFQFTADLPGRGETELIQSPSLEVAAQRMNSAQSDPWGYVSYSMGGAFLVPWSSRISGTVSPDGKELTTDWHGHPLTLRVNSSGKYAVHGLIHKNQVVDVQKTVTADGATVTGVLHAKSFGGRWPSSTDVHYTVALSGPSLEITLVATNVGDQAEPMAIGWHPYFLLPSHDRSQARLHVAATRYAGTVPTDGLTTGKLLPTAGSSFDFRAESGGLLSAPINVNFSGLQSDSKCPASIIDPAANYGLCIRPISSEIHTIQVYSPKDGSFIAVEPQTNFPDPLGKEWGDMDTGFRTLQHGESVTWKVRLELFKP
jgi:aldose 1-epimerase